MLRHLAGPALFITLSLTGIVWLAQSLRFVDLIVNRGLSINLFLYLTALLMPSLLAVVLPVALFCAVLYSYNRMISESELIVLESAGLSLHDLAKPALIAGAALVLAGYVISLWLLPASYREFKDMQFFIRNNYASLLLQEGVFSTPMNGMMVYIRKREPDGILRGIMVHDTTGGKKPITMMARQGYLVNSGDGPQFVLKDGNRQEVNHSTGQLSLLHFDHYTLNLSMYTETQDMRSREPQEEYLPTLLSPSSDLPEDRRRKLLAEAHQRLSWPLTSLALALAAVAGLISGEFNRRGHVRRMMITGAAGAGILAASLAVQNLAAKHALAVPLMYALPCLVMLVSWIILRHGGMPALRQPKRHLMGA